MQYYDSRLHTKQKQLTPMWENTSAEEEDKLGRASDELELALFTEPNTDAEKLDAIIKYLTVVSNASCGAWRSAAQASFRSNIGRIDDIIQSIAQAMEIMNANSDRLFENFEVLASNQRKMEKINYTLPMLHEMFSEYQGL